MGSPLPWHVFSFATLFSLGLYHLVRSTRSYLLRSPHSSHHSHSHGHSHSYIARPYYPLPHRNHLLRHLPLYLTLLSLLLSSILTPLLSPPQLLLPSLHLSSILLLFSLLLALISLPFLPQDLSFLLLSLPFLLLSRLRPFPDDLLPIHSKLSSVSSAISLSSALLSLALALRPRLFPAELALAASVALRGLWSLQSGLSLYSDAFVPDGCHRLFDVPPEVSTRCELQSYRARAEQLLDLAFAIHASLAAAVAVAVYAAIAWGASGVRKSGSYEALPTSASAGSLGEIAMEHVQMKALAKSSAQA